MAWRRGSEASHVLVNSGETLHYTANVCIRLCDMTEMDASLTQRRPIVTTNVVYSQLHVLSLVAELSDTVIRAGQYTHRASWTVAYTHRGSSRYIH